MDVVLPSEGQQEAGRDRARRRVLRVEGVGQRQARGVHAEQHVDQAGKDGEDGAEEEVANDTWIARGARAAGAHGRALRGLAREQDEEDVDRKQDQSLGPSHGGEAGGGQRALDPAQQREPHAEQHERDEERDLHPRGAREGQRRVHREQRGGDDAGDPSESERTGHRVQEHGPRSRRGGTGGFVPSTTASTLPAPATACTPARSSTQSGLVIPVSDWPEL